MFKRSFLPMLLMIALVAGYSPVPAANAAPGDPDALLYGGVEKVTATNIPSDATQVVLYTQNGTAVLTLTGPFPGSSIEIAPVSPGTGYFVQSSRIGYVYPGSNMVTVAPHAPTANGGFGKVSVSDATGGATLKLHQSGNPAGVLRTLTLEAGATEGEFDLVPYGTDYYVIQNVNGVDSTNSAFVTSSLPAPVASGGVHQVTVTEAHAAAELELFRDGGTSAGTATLLPSQTSHTFADVAPGLGYYVVQTHAGASSAASNTVTVAPPAVSASGGEGRVTVSGATGGSVLKLYAAGGGVPVATRTIGPAETGYPFTGIAPGLGYYATQTVNGAESVGSNTVTSSPAPVQLLGGTRSAQATGALPGATVKLYRFDGVLHSSYDMQETETSHLFTGVIAGTGYYAIQSINGTESIGSNTVTVAPSGLSVLGDEQAASVTGADPGAVLKLYRGNGGAALAEHALGASESEYTFPEVVPGLNYYATQTVGGAESLGSNTVTVAPRAPAIRRGERSVTVTQAVYGADVILYRSDGTEWGRTVWQQDQLSYVFGNVPPAHNYYATQQLNGAISRASGLVASLPPVVTAEAGVRTVNVSGILAGATVTLYDNNGTAAAVATPSGTLHAFSGLSAGSSYTVTQTVNDVESLPSATVTVRSESTGGNNNDGDTKKPEEPKSVRDIRLLLDGDPQLRLATGEAIRMNGKAGIRAKLNEEALLKKLEQALDGRTLTLDLSDIDGPVIAEWSGSFAKALQDRGLLIEIRTSRSAYRLPASELRLAERMGEWGLPASATPGQLVVSVSLIPAGEEEAGRFQRAAASLGAEVAGDPVEFLAEARYGDKKLKFGRYGVPVERELILPGVDDASKLTTGVVYDPSTASLRPVPTSFSIVDGSAYARIGSPTNSLYGVVFHRAKLDDKLPAWSEKAVRDIADRLVMGTERTKKGESFFRPERNASRAEYVSALVRMLGLYAPEATGKGFADVPNGTAFASDIRSAASYGIAEGVPGGAFQPDRPVERAEALTMLERALKAAGIEDRLVAVRTVSALDGFSDSGEVPAWAKDSVSFAVDAGLVLGSGNRLDPDRAITRGETAVLLQRVLIRSKLIQP